MVVFCVEKAWKVPYIFFQMLICEEYLDCTWYPAWLYIQVNQERFLSCRWFGESEIEKKWEGRSVDQLHMTVCWRIRK